MGYPEYDASWEPEENLRHATELVQEYQTSRTMLEEGGSGVTGYIGAMQDHSPTTRFYAEQREEAINQ
jgi:hypothetical protein